MKIARNATIAFSIYTCITVSVMTGCRKQQNAATSQTRAAGSVIFDGGYETNPIDHGRPVALIAAALGVESEVFRQAFSNVNPSSIGPPTPSRARDNKKVLMDALSKYGVTNDRLDEVSDFYRYRPQSGKRWRHVPATAIAIMEDGEVTGLKITNPGSGYLTAPEVSIVGHEGVKIDVEIEFTQDLQTNGHISSLTLKPN